ncbi:hypothetical protein COLO4_22906 [Corchorus olitorius]|uniref:Uncharacterized protein n=1 Tax=Corchorus olitorius TaxID=93759 RepID=A0A1R3IJ87_9ROSI|nr:hypothetical protein COLO4_22906 [Corchorus olitorius]
MGWQRLADVDLSEFSETKGNPSNFDSMFLLIVASEAAIERRGRTGGGRDESETFLCTKKIIMEEQNNIDTETQADGSGGGSAPTPTNGSAASQNETPISSRSIRGKTDMAWVQQSLNDFEQQKRVNQANIDDMNPFGRSVHQFEGDFIDVESQGTQNTSSGSIGTSSAAKKRTVGSARGILSYFPSGTSPGSQPSIKAALQSKERWGQENDQNAHDVSHDQNAHGDVEFDFSSFDIARAPSSSNQANRT